MVDATDRAIKLVLGEEPAALSRVTVYSLGDGKRPLSAAALCLHMPSSWKYVSIDPLLEVDAVDLGEYGDRFSLFRGQSQDFDLSHTRMENTTTTTTTATATKTSITPPATETQEIKSPSSLAIVIALHSHAPLSEFWTRLGGKKVAITCECCAEYSELHSVGESPIMEFDDFEVYSPKRRVKIYSSSSASPPSTLLPPPPPSPLPLQTAEDDVHTSSPVPLSPQPISGNKNTTTITKRKASSIE